jgi:hypothetical protein
MKKSKSALGFSKKPLLKKQEVTTLFYKGFTKFFFVKPW